MRNYYYSLLLIAVGFSSNAQINPEKDPILTRSLTTDDIRSVLSETSGGSISVTGVNAGDARIEVYVRPNNSKENKLSEQEVRDRIASDYELTIAVSGNKLTATAKPKDRNMNWKKSLNFSFKIFVPKNVTTKLSTSGGSIDLTNLEGEQDFSTSGGSLHVDNVGGKIRGRTSGGSIHLADSKDDIELSTSGGGIDAKNCNGKLRLSTSGGSLNLKNLNGDIRATTSGGSINGKNISGELITHTSGGSIDLDDLSCSLEASTSGGHVDVAIRELGKYIKIHNSSGSIELELPKNKGLNLDLAGQKIKTDKLENFNGKIESDELTGKLNGGGVPVNLRSGGGTIYLVLK